MTSSGNPQIWFVAFVAAALAATASPARADAPGKSLTRDDKNEVRAVTFDEDGGATRVHVRGAQTPTFTVYKLDKPTRVVIDVPQARLAEAVRGHDSSMTLSPNTWAVSTIAAQQLDDGGSVVRVIVTLARPGRYDVKTDGNEVIVTVMARDVAPKTANPAELEAARKQAASAEQAKTQAEQAKAQAEQAKTQAEQAKSQAEHARAQAEQVSAAAQDQAAKATARAEVAQRALEDAKQLQKKNAATSADLERAKVAAAAAQSAATTAQNDAMRAKAEAAKASSDMAKAKSDVAKANDAATTAQADAERTRAAAEQAKREADAKLQQAQSETANARREAQDLKTAMSSEIAKAREDVAKARDEAQKAHADADAAKADAAREKSNADAIRVQADAARAAAAADKRQAEAEKREAVATRADAEAEKREANATRADAEKMVASAKDQVAALAKKTAAAQALEDQARTANAAAQAREENARNEANRAVQERLAAEAAAQRAQEARDKSTTQAASERARLVAEAKAAEERLAQAKRATQEAEAHRVAAETAADNAKDQLDRSKVSLSSIDHDRQTAEAAATDAVRKRSEAEAAATDAARKRSEAEAAASDAAKRQHLAEVAASEAAQRRGQAEQQRAAADAQRVAAEQAAHAAQVAKDAAEHQRAIAEKSAKDALGAQHNAEASLSELMDRRAAAEKAAAAVEERAKAEAKAQEQVAAAKARKAGEDELAKANAAAAQIETERKHAETELAQRRKAVSSQQAEVARLETAAMQAKDAADREETRRAQLAQKRADEEQQLALLQAKKLTVQQQIAATPAPAPITKTAPAPIAPAPIAKPIAVAKAAPAPAAKNAQINDVRFTGDADGGEVQLAIAGDAEVRLGEVTPKFVELVIDRADLAAKLERKLDVSALGGPVRSVSSFHDRQQPGRVHIIAELGAPVTPTLERDGTGAQVKFAGVGQIAKKSPGPRTQEMPPPIVSGFGAASTPIAQQSVSQVPPPNAPNSRRRIYHGATVDLDFKDAPIHDLLRTIAAVGHISLVVPETVDAKVTVSLKHVPWDQALDVILSSHGLWYRREGNIFRVAPRKDLDAEDEAEAARREAAIKAEAPRPEIITLNYASASEIKPKLDGMTSPKGKIEVDERTNALIINDVAGNRAQIARLAYDLDIQTPQITVEARIVEADSNFTRDIGIQWGGNALAGATGGNATGLTFPSSIGITGANVDQNTIATGVASPSDFAVNLPAATGSGAGGAIGFSLGSLAGNFNINLRLSALEDNGSVRIISAPKITVLNGREAKIAQGTSVPISVVSAAGTNTQFIQADLSLTVKPYVSLRDCTIAMDLNVTNNQPDFTHTSANGIPTIQRKEAHTRMLVRDGETSVLGGIYTRSTGVQYSKVPFLGDLPVLGWLFKRRVETDNRGELLVFMTPRITNRAALRCSE